MFIDYTLELADTFGTFYLFREIIPYDIWENWCHVLLTYILVGLEFYLLASHMKVFLLK